MDLVDYHFQKELQDLAALGSLLGGIGGMVFASIIAIPCYINDYRIRQKRILEREKKDFRVC